MSASPNPPPKPGTDPAPLSPPPAATTAPGSADRRRWLGVGMVGLAAGATGYWWQSRSCEDPSATPPTGGGSPASSPAALGEDFWALTLPQPEGPDLALSSLRGRPLLINFWATWCPPCVREMPLLDSFYQQNKSKSLQMLGIAVDGAKPVTAFLARQPVSFLVALAGAEGSGLARALGNSAGGLPYTVLADAQGRILRRQMGELQAAQLAQWGQLL